MADSVPPADRGDDASVSPDSRSAAAYPGTPRWVKVPGIGAVLVSLLIGFVHLTGVAPSAHVSPVKHGVQQP
jgi:hypothetical protein